MKKTITAILMALSMLVTGCGVDSTLDTPATTDAVASNETITYVTKDTYVEETENTTVIEKAETHVAETTNVHNESVASRADSIPNIVIDDITIPTGFDYIKIDNGIWAGKYVWNFDDDITRGAVATDNLRSGSIKVLDWEAYYGLDAFVDGSFVYVKAYNHSNNHDIINTYVQYPNGDIADININYNDYTYIDATDYSNGLYALTCEFDTMTVPVYVYINKGIPYCVRITDTTKPIERYEFINDYIADNNFTPSMALKNDDFEYPTWDDDLNRNDADVWIQLSHDLLDDYPDWSDEMKIWRLTEWMLSNIRYDYWRFVNGPSRAMRFNVWDGTYSMWDMHIGVCCDFTNVMVMMLREQGIPTSSLANERHLWNIVYLDGMWHEFDITTMMPYMSYEFKADDCVNRGAFYTDYMMGCEESENFTGVDIELYNANFWNNN